MKQLSIDDAIAAAQIVRSRARRHDPSTSKDAALRSTSFAANHENRIAAALSELGARGGTIYELATATGLDHVAVARRMKKLEADGRAVRPGARRATPSGGAAAVWFKPGAVTTSTGFASSLEHAVEDPQDADGSGATPTTRKD